MHNFSSKLTLPIDVLEATPSLYRRIQSIYRFTIYIEDLIDAKIFTLLLNHQTQFILDLKLDSVLAENRKLRVSAGLINRHVKRPKF